MATLSTKLSDVDHCSNLSDAGNADAGLTPHADSVTKASGDGPNLSESGIH